MTSEQRESWLLSAAQCRAQADEARACGDEEHAYTMRQRAAWWSYCANVNTCEELREELLKELGRGQQN